MEEYIWEDESEDIKNDILETYNLIFEQLHEIANDGEAYIKTGSYKQAMLCQKRVSKMCIELSQLDNVKYVKTPSGELVELIGSNSTNTCNECENSENVMEYSEFISLIQSIVNRTKTMKYSDIEKYTKNNKNIENNNDSSDEELEW